MNELTLVIQWTPPSGNHYKNYRIAFPKGGGKPFVQWYVTDEGLAWYAAVAAIAAGRKILGEQLDVSYIVYHPPTARADVDNYAKCILDSLTHAGIIKDDRYVDDFHGHKRPSAENPRTIIRITSAQEQFFERLN